MVGKIQDIVSASIVAGAAERVSDTSSRMKTADYNDQEQQVKRIDDVQNAPKYNQAEEEEDPLKGRDGRRIRQLHDAGIERAHEQD